VSQQLLLTLGTGRELGHIIASADADTLEDFLNLFLDFQNRNKVGIHGVDGCNELWGGTIFPKDTKK
jgi:hypothetical protein